MKFQVIPSGPNQILGLNLAGAHLPILGTLLNILYKLLLLILKLDALTVKFSLSFLESSLMFAETLLGRHPLSESPFYDLEKALGGFLVIIRVIIHSLDKIEPKQKFSREIRVVKFAMCNNNNLYLSSS